MVHEPEKNIFLWAQLKWVIACTIIIPTIFTIAISYIYTRFYLSTDFIDPMLFVGILFEAFFFCLVTFILRKVYQLQTIKLVLYPGDLKQIFYYP